MNRTPWGFEFDPSHGWEFWDTDKPPGFCGKCGQAIVVEVRYKLTFCQRDGDQTREARSFCPNRRRRLDGHHFESWRDLRHDHYQWKGDATA